MNLFVDTGVWSLAWRRDMPSEGAEIERLRRALISRETIRTTSLVLQELLQGFRGPKARATLIERFGALPLLAPDRDDYIEAAELRNTCRQNGIRIGTVDALLAQLTIRHDLVLLTTDRDFHHASRFVPLKVWGAGE